MSKRLVSVAAWALTVGAGALVWSCATSVDGGPDGVDPSGDAAPDPTSDAATDVGVAGDDDASPATGDDDAPPTTGDDDATPDPGGDAATGDGDDTTDDASVSDAGERDDGGETTDAGIDASDVSLVHDAGVDSAVPHDAGSDAADAALPVDAGHDAGPPDAGPPDAGPVDAGHDAGPPDAGCSVAIVVINEVQTSGAGGAEDEWVELYNPTNCAIDVSNWTLKHASINGTTVSTVFTLAAGTSLAAGGYGVIGGITYSAAVPTIGRFNTGVLADTGGGLGLYSTTSALMDAMGYGAGANNPLVQTSPAPADVTSSSIARVPNGADTNDDAVDFTLVATPTPGAKN